MTKHVDGDSKVQMVLDSAVLENVPRRQGGPSLGRPRYAPQLSRALPHQRCPAAAVGGAGGGGRAGGVTCRAIHMIGMISLCT